MKSQGNLLLFSAKSDKIDGKSPDWAILYANWDGCYGNVLFALRTSWFTALTHSNGFAYTSL
jgi:hypothetical protein